MLHSMTEYNFMSVTGQMNLESTSLADDQILDTFKTLAENIKPDELNKHLKDILREYPDLCKKLALPI